MLDGFAGVKPAFFPPALLPRQMHSLGQLVLQHLESRGAMWPEIYPADAHDAPLLPRQMRALTGQLVSQHLQSRGPCGRKYTQLMLVMLPSCLVAITGAVGFAASGVVAGNIPS